MINTNSCLKIKLGILTSSRADYGIYKSLLKELSSDTKFELHIIVFGTHLLEKFGFTIQEIKKDNFGNIYKISGMSQSDSLLDIGKGYSILVKSFTNFWASHHFDWVVALGDRFEMSAAVQASIPFEVKIAHLHGGETTLGATDNIYRHQISLASNLHFVASEEYKERVSCIIGEKDCVYNVGALSLDGIEALALPDWHIVCSRFNIPNLPFVLVTLHPETVRVDRNTVYAKVIYRMLEKLSNQLHIVVTMPNADAFGSKFRDVILKLKSTYPANFSLVENFGKENYFAAMKACAYLLGNTSSGIAEAASFNKYVINVGDRQKGRLRSENVVDVPFDTKKILDAAREIEKRGEYKGINKYYQPNTAKKMTKILANA